MIALFRKAVLSEARIWTRRGGGRMHRNVDLSPLHNTIYLNTLLQFHGAIMGTTPCCATYNISLVVKLPTKIAGR